MERIVRREAHAKINYFLRVLGRRADGYHDIESLVVPVSLADEITVRNAPELRFTVNGELADAVPLDESNLVVRSALLLAEVCEMEPLADIELHKRIPVAAGLGGGSADAAAALSALNALWGCALGDDSLLDIAAKVGSDVPALLAGRPVMVRGRGEIVEDATATPGWWVLVTMGFGVAVSDAYRWWDEDGGPRAMADHRELFNDLEGPVGRRHPEVLETKRILLEEGAVEALLCGSGPTVAGLAPDEEEAKRISERVPGSIAVSAPP